MLTTVYGIVSTADNTQNHVSQHACSSALVIILFIVAMLDQVTVAPYRQDI